MKKALFILGTRPEVIKMAPIIHSLNQSNMNIKPLVCTTSQHRQMQDSMLKLFKIKPDYDLDIMQPNQTLSYVSATVLTKLEPILKEVNPDIVLVQGDTITAFAAALSGYLSKIPVAHIEAGLRTGNLYSPFPEEGSRRLIGSIASWHYAPTQAAANNLYQENIPPNKVFVTGNPIIDALFWVLNHYQENDFLNELPLSIQEILKNQKPFVLITGHRRESFGKGFVAICEAIKELAEAYPYFHFIYPVHLNPNVQEPVYNLLARTANIHLLEPLGYLPFTYLLKASYLVLTDSGGVQEEAPSLGKPVLVMRELTERTEGITAGTAKLVGTDKEKIICEVKALIENKEAYNMMANAVSPYGDGHSAERIASHLAQILN